MQDLPILAELPDGYFVEESPRGILAVHASIARTLHESGYGPDVDGLLRRSELEGRRPLWELAGTEQPVLVRRFSHGGLMRWVTGDRFMDAERPFRELILSDLLLRNGIETPRVLAARARSLGVGWQLDVMTLRVEDSIDLGWVLGAVRRGEIEARDRQRLMASLGNLVRRLHRHGVLHADLQPNNILVNRSALAGEAPILTVLDLDKSRIVSKVRSEDRLANLTRLYRHVARRDRKHGPAITHSDVARFFRSYDPDGAQWRSDWNSVRERHAMGLTLHRIGWGLERMVAGRKDDARSEQGVLVPTTSEQVSDRKGQ